MDYNIIYIAIFFGLLYAGSDAWHDNKVIEKDKKWHNIDAFIKFIVSIVFGLIIYYYTKDWLLSSIASGIIFLIRASIFNPILNTLMDWGFWYRRKKGFDKIPIWVWWILLAGLLTFAFVSCETSTPIEKTDIAFVQDEAPIKAATIKGSQLLIPNIPEPIECNNIYEAIKIIEYESKDKSGIFVNEEMAIYLKVSFFKK